MRHLFFIIALLALAANHAYGATTEPSAKVFKSRGATQCEPTSGTPPEMMGKELEKAGITVISIACGQDGRMYAALCGSPDGKINIFEIPERKIPQASTLGFAKLSSLHDAKERPCQ